MSPHDLKKSAWTVAGEGGRSGKWETKTFQAKIEALSRRSSNDLHSAWVTFCSACMGRPGAGRPQHAAHNSEQHHQFGDWWITR